jgi:hypothetical protein
MIEYFPLQGKARVITDDDFRHHTRHTSLAGLTPAERAAAHYTTLLQSPTLKLSNTRNGYCFCVCVYDALVAAGVDPQRITFNSRASKERNDDIDLRIAPSNPTKAMTCIYLKTSLRERWKQVDRDARIAKDVWGNRTRTVCLIYAEKGAPGFLKDCDEQDELAKKFTKMEEWAYGVDTYAALSQTAKVNAIIAYLVEASRYANGVAWDKC